ncbi:peptidoglycan-binding protein [Halomonas qinghailakensis]|uniref:Peptidoglycan-binding protein n=2 Tax=Halomonas TaxID=2745 RepID=A0AA46TN31_9GAMM|nr:MULTISPECIES: peptidoglycan-binding domain-containing protein [Halomonas]UYO73369.1 peptidoglycan-binding protein [Halomonas sp. ZZQ-149]UYV18536.1 peptidoglycan-binding protein [Halomonas qaidamensis]
MRHLLLFLFAFLPLMMGCDNMRPTPITSELLHLSVAELVGKIDSALSRLEYSNGKVGVNLGRVGMRMELRTLQSCLEQLDYFDGPRLGILDDKTVAAIERYLANRDSLL